MFIEYFFLWFLIIFTGYFLILFGFMHFSSKKDVLNNIFAFGALFIVFIHILIFLLLMLQQDYLHKSVIPLWLLVLGLPIIIVGLIVLVSTLIVNLYRVIFGKKDFSKFEQKVTKKIEDMSKIKRDSYRKISHILIFVGLFILWYIGYDFVEKSGEQWVSMIPEENNTLYLYLRLLSEKKSMVDVLFALGWFYYLIFFFFYIFCIISLANELTRKTKKLAFPFNLFTIIITEEEKESYGTYLYFAIGQLFAAFLCPPMVFFAILGMSGIADLTASQVGIRWGKTHIKWNNKKTWEGTLAATTVAFIICIFFVGLIWAIIFTFAFMCFDLFTEKPIKISDNLLIPIGCALIYFFIRYFLNLNYYTIIIG